jgi:hypothetical protein
MRDRHFPQSRTPLQNAERGAPAQNTPFLEVQLYALNIPIWTHGRVSSKSAAAVVSQKQHSRCLECASTAHLLSSEVFHLISQYPARYAKNDFAFCHERPVPPVTA